LLHRRLTPFEPAILGTGLVLSVGDRGVPRIGNANAVGVEPKQVVAAIVSNDFGPGGHSLADAAERRIRGRGIGVRSACHTSNGNHGSVGGADELARDEEVTTFPRFEAAANKRARRELPVFVFRVVVSRLEKAEKVLAGELDRHRPDAWNPLVEQLDIHGRR